MISSKSLEKSIDLVRSAFKEYYFKNTDLIDIPECIRNANLDICNLDQA